MVEALADFLGFFPGARVSDELRPEGELSALVRLDLVDRAEVAIEERTTIGSSDDFVLAVPRVPADLVPGAKLGDRAVEVASESPELRERERDEPRLPATVAALGAEESSTARQRTRS